MLFCLPTRFCRALALAGALAAARPTLAQHSAPAAADTLHQYESPARATPALALPAPPWYRGPLARATAVPVALVGLGVLTMGHHGGEVSSTEAREELREHFPRFHTHVDDYLQMAPFLELGAVALAGVDTRNDRLNTLLVIGKAEVLMTATVYALKTTTRVLRPDGSARNAFPSGHTAQAFLAASIVHAELRDRSPWYGVGAYTIATGVGALRMLNNRHWLSDVVAGAGIGILSAHAAYLSHRHHWGRPARPAVAACRVAPRYYAGSTGLSVQWVLR